MKADIFKTELGYIKEDDIREKAIKVINMLPDYFFEVPASSTGKYHPSFSQGEGGLVRHTKSAVNIANELLNHNSVIGDAFTLKEKDLMILCLLVHDGLKSGLVKQEYTVFEHPIIIGKYIIDNNDKIGFSDKELEFIDTTIKTHMGEWTKDYNGNEVLERPHNKYQKFVHMCDFLSSKKFLDIKFDGNEIVK